MFQDNIGSKQTHDGAVVDDDVRLLSHTGPLFRGHSEFLTLEITDDNLETTIGDPRFFPCAAAFATFAQSLQSLLLRAGADVADDFGNSAAATIESKEVAEDEGAEETGGAGQEDDLACIGRDRLLIRIAQSLGERLGILAVLVVASSSRIAVRVRATLLVIARETEVGVSEGIDFLREGADGREVEDKTERQTGCQRLAQLENEACSENRVASEVKEGFVERDMRRRGGEQLDPDVVNSLLSRVKLVSRGLFRRRRRASFGGSGGGRRDRVGEGQRRLVDFAVRVQRHPRKRDNDCRARG